MISYIINVHSVCYCNKARYYCFHYYCMPVKSHS